MTMQHDTKQYVLSPQAILRYLITDDDEMDTLVMCKSSEITLTTTDHKLYEALGSVKEYDDFRLNKLVKLIEVVDIVSNREQLNANKPVLKDERVEELRTLALKKTK